MKNQSAVSRRGFLRNGLLAAGAVVACSIAVRQRIQPREVKVAELQARLRADGVNLEI